MNKKYLKIAVLLAAALCVLFVFAACEEEKPTDETFEFANGVITGLTEEGKLKTELTIPSMLADEAITEIGLYAFKDTVNLKKVTFESGIKIIGSSAFYGSAVETVVLSSTVETIGNSAFIKCSNLAEINLTNVKHIDRSAFQSCHSLKEITIPESITTVSDGAFSNCNELAIVNLPASVKVIGKGAFSSCFKLTAIDLSHVETIERDAFIACGLKTLDIPSNVKTIGPRAFRYNSQLTEVVVRAESIGLSAFSGCSKLESVRLEDGVKTVGSKAFANCVALSELYIGDTVESLGTNLLYDKDINKEYPFTASLLTEIFIPASVTEIGKDAFDGVSEEICFLCEAEAQPADWNKKWKPEEALNVLWGQERA